ncbi:NifB/NifX family molybdenum-iron cluster-binding protein [Paludibaculum fermentans]|uniref:NifB/NifX family molybdenum-iron cluster-binding protein n=1 Tax=Paludibaculum fermentans TaxID=1473598 RepID=UPI003EBEEEDD
MRIAIPTSDGDLDQHFGHCARFALIDVNPATKEITATMEVAAPEHQPGLLPPWLKERNVNVVIAGGMGTRAQTLFQGLSIEVITGAPPEKTLTLVRQYLDGSLVTRPHTCSH